VKPTLHSLKKYSYLRFALPWLSLVLPFIGQEWSQKGWSFAYFALFIPFLAYYVKVLPTKNPRKMSFPQWGFFFFYYVCTETMGDFAFQHRSTLGRTILDAFITGFILSLGVLDVRRLAVELKLQELDNLKGFPFELNAEAFRLPEQSLDPASYPRVPTNSVNTIPD
jgi:hypothetical protein